MGLITQSPTMNETVQNELAKCILVCSNCHKEIHAGIQVIPETYDLFSIEKYNSYMQENNGNRIAQKRLAALGIESVMYAVRNNPTITKAGKSIRTDYRLLRMFFEERSIKWDDVLKEVGTNC